MAESGPHPKGTLLLKYKNNIVRRLFSSSGNSYSKRPEDRFSASSIPVCDFKEKR